MIRKLIVSVSALFLVLGASRFCHGTGFYNPDQSISGQGQVDAVVARPQDASTVYYNPAGMVRLSPWEITAGLHSLLMDLEYTSPVGRAEEASDTFFIPHMYFSANPPNSKFAAGLSVNAPFGLGTDWGANSFARYIAPYSELNLIMVNPNVAYSLTDNFSVAAGVDFYTAEVTFDRYVPGAMSPFGGPTGMDIGTSLKADGDAWGWNLGLLYLLSDRVSFGASYRSKADLDLSGPLRTYPASPVSLSGSLDMHLPSMLKAGLAVQPTDALTIELDADWLEWSRFKNVPLSISPPVMPPEVSPRDWDDVLLYSIGAQYAFKNGWKLRAGYGYAESPIPDRTYEPGIPRNDLHVVSFGAGKDLGKLSLDLACTFIMSEERKVNSDVGEPFMTVDGAYDSLITVIGAGFSYRF
ncbi:TonB-dependent receptor [bacterium]|nr:TonB-dependent receptor [bacterium]